MVIVVTDCGENMPSKGARKRLVDVLDEIKDGDIDSSIILTKFILLQQRIESHNPSINDKL
jgi:hypothetical protein